MAQKINSYGPQEVFPDQICLDDSLSDQTLTWPGKLQGSGKEAGGRQLGRTR